MWNRCIAVLSKALTHDHAALHRVLSPYFPNHWIFLNRAHSPCFMDPPEHPALCSEYVMCYKMLITSGNIAEREEKKHVPYRQIITLAQLLREVPIHTGMFSFFCPLLLVLA